MSCKKHLIPQYIRNEMDVDTLLEFLLHIDDCPRCRNAVYAARRLSDAEYFEQSWPVDRRHRKAI